jgi:Tol biopolymer transport system component
MNLFRVAIDPATGGASGAPEQMTTSVGNLGWFRFSADGRRLVGAAYDRSAELHLYHLTTGAAPTLQPLRTLRPRFLHWCKVSPDGGWLACSTIGTPEDLVLLRADGSELRRLTDDPFKDRNVSWSHDGTRLAFDSTRSGAWNLWTVRADGSELRRIADTPETSAGAWSLDGQRLTLDLRDGVLGEVAADRFTARDAIRSIPLPDPLRKFELGAWSPSGDLLGGTEVDPNLGALSIGAFEPATGTYRRSQLPMKGADWVNAIFKFAGWLPDSRHFVASGREQIALVNVETGAWRGLQAVDKRRLFVSLSRDGRTLLVEEEAVDGDLWMLEIPGGEK